MRHATILARDTGADNAAASAAAQEPSRPLDTTMRLQYTGALGRSLGMSSTGAV
jgi:hypothetical protein